jgi:Aspartyl protease
MFRFAAAFRTQANRSTSVLADPGPLPWIYPYREDPQSTRLGQPVFRPFVQISLAAADRSTPVLDGLIDTGADAILASDLLADQLDLDLEDNDGQTAHAVGGRTVTARYKTVELRLHSADPTASQYRQWQAQVGFISGWHSYSFVLLGSVGFLDQWTVTASRFAQAVAIEAHDAFDERFGVLTGP